MPSFSDAAVGTGDPASQHNELVDALRNVYDSGQPGDVLTKVALGEGVPTVQMRSPAWIDARDFGAATTNSPAANDAALAAAVAAIGTGSLPGGTLVISERLDISATLVLEAVAIRVVARGGGFAGAEVPFANAEGDLDDGGLRWQGPPGIPMVELRACLGVAWECPLQGNTASPPSAFIELADPAGVSPDNQSVFIGNCRLGGKGWGLRTAYAADVGIKFSGSVGNDLVFMERLEINGCIDAGIDNDDHNAIWGSFKDVSIGGDTVQTGVGIRTRAGFDALNLSFNRCDVGIQTVSNGPRITVVGLRSEHTAVLAAMSAGSSLAVYGGRMLCVAGVQPDAPLLTANVGNGGSLVLENLYFLGLSGLSPRPWVQIDGSTAGGNVRINGCAELRIDDVRFDLQSGAGVFVDAQLVGDGAFGGSTFRGYLAQGLERLLEGPSMPAYLAADPRGPLADADAADCSGARYASAATSNTPIAGFDGAILTLRWDASWSYQIACSWITGAAYVRHQSNIGAPTWSAWSAVQTS